MPVGRQLDLAPFEAGPVVAGGVGQGWAYRSMHFDLHDVSIAGRLSVASVTNS